jgi:hypothetical protein
VMKMVDKPGVCIKLHLFWKIRIILGMNYKQKLHQHHSWYIKSIKRKEQSKMISALKKLARKNNEAKARPSMPSGVSSMGHSLQRKFGRGVRYNSMYCFVVLPLWLFCVNVDSKIM